MRRLASKVVKAKAFWTVTEMLTSTVNPKMAKSGSVSISMLKASFKVFNILVQYSNNLGHSHNMWMRFAGDCLHLLHASLTEGYIWVSLALV